MTPHFTEVVSAIVAVLEFGSGRGLEVTTLLEADLGMDSGLMLELIMQLEDTIPGLAIDQAGLTSEDFRSIGSLCAYVAARIAKPEAA